jgi:hypothetical protein
MTARRWHHTAVTSVSESMAALGHLMLSYPEGAGHIWTAVNHRGVVYAFIEADGIHVPLIEGEEVVDSLTQAEALLEKFVMDEFGEVF